jgi:hypothetical protein
MSSIRRAASVSQACVYQEAWDRRPAAWWLAAVALCLASLALARAGHAQASFRGLGFLPGGEHWSSSIAVSADGSVVVGQGTSASNDEAFRWSAAGGMVGLLPGDYSAATGVSSDGTVVVGYSYGPRSAGPSVGQQQAGR